MIGQLFNVGDTISFDVYPSAILGSKYQNVVVLGALNGQTVQQLGVDVAALHAQVKPSLPEGSPENPFAANYLFLQIQYPNRTIDYVGIPWIIVNTVSITNQVDIVIRIRREIALNSEKARVALVSAGFTLDADSISIEPSSTAPA